MEDSIYEYDENNFKVTEEMKKDYNKYGYVLVRNLLNKDELTKVKEAVEHKNGVTRHTFNRDDALTGGNKSMKLTLWNHPGHDVTGVLSKLQKTAGTMEELMGDEEIYHYHSKLNMKDARSGGAFLWHQDYGYWHKYTCPLPEMGSVLLAIDPCSKDNGCLIIMKGSQAMGRLDHKQQGEQQTVADEERLEQAKKMFPEQYVEMNGGDALFFDCNLLHSSSQNDSDIRRWVLIHSYNKKRNNPYKEHHHASYTPMEKLDNSALMACNNIENHAGKWFMRNEDDGLATR